MRRLTLVIAACTLTLSAAPPVDPSHGEGVPATGATPDAAIAMKAFKFDQSLAVTLFAAEPLLANPVAFSPDERGRWFIAESYRQENGVEDNRGHMNWLDDDFAARTTDDRLAMMRKFYPDPKVFAEKFAKHEERITLVEDTNGDGIADKTSVFADGFRDPLDGTGAGILALRENVWWTCIPNLWRFRAGPDGKAAEKGKLLTGFGVKFAFRGHDMHGLRLGPDGWLYFSIGDRALNVKTPDGRQVTELETGAVLRCRPDGSGLEIFATGLRNPQELAFNQFGDLFTGDNNSDSGDQARLLQIVEGGDYGWRMAYQYLPDRGPWNREKLWDEKLAPQARYILPPIANIGDGPAGLTFNPGTGLSAKYAGHFFLSDFRGGPAASVVHDITIEPRGGGYRLKQRDDFVKGILTTDVEFGPDGGLYVLDWVEGWQGAGKGRIYKFTAKDADRDAQRATQELIAGDFAKKSVDELIALLAHADQRVRLAAQFELADRGQPAVVPLAKLAQDRAAAQLARIHAIWGLGQLAKFNAATAGPLLGLLGSPDAEVRAQAAKVLGFRRLPAAGNPLTPLLADASLRVRFQAAIALGKIGHKAAVEPLFALLADNADRDPFVRHGAVFALASLATGEQLAAKKADVKVAVRAGAVLALRRQRSPLVADFLRDTDENVALEAARAVHDAPIVEALPALAALVAPDAPKNPRIAERAVNAAYRLGAPAQAKALTAFTLDATQPEAARRDAMEALGAWANPSPKDRVLGMWRPLPARPAKDAVAALQPEVAKFFTGQPAAVQETAARTARRLELKAVAPQLRTLAMDEKAAIGSRIAAVQALTAFKDAKLSSVANAALVAKDSRLRAEGLQALAASDPVAAVAAIGAVISRGSVREKQGGLVALAQMRTPEAKEQLGLLLDQFVAGKCPPEIQLDLIEAAAKAGLRDRVKQLEAALPKDDRLAPYRLALAGGDVDRGRRIFREKAEVQCLRCHKCEIGDSLVGPDLTKIGAQRDRAHLLESIVFPSAHVSEGFEIVTLTTQDNQMIAGRLVKENDGKLTIETMDEKGRVKTVNVGADKVKERIAAPSPMPENTRDQLTRRELRDLVEYLATRK
ncbi:MAG: PVC-type heme-binding CxxCH protein [Chthoniobacteraceae bacterium]